MATHEPKPLALPQEICGIICKEVGIEYVHNLCLLSHSFRHEAERLLYVDPWVVGMRAVKSWCFAVNRRPYLAHGIQWLTIFLPPQLDFEADDLTHLYSALHHCVNLTELYVHMHVPTLPGNALAKISNEVQAWILEDHPFKLKSFKNSYFRPNTLAKFLRSQPTIKTLMLKNSGPAGINDVPMPNLRNLECSSGTLQELSMPSWHPRRITRLEYKLDCASDVEELGTFVAVTQFAETLKSLSIYRHSTANGRGLDVAVLAACVAAQVPDIKFLQILDRTMRSETFHIPFLPFPIPLRRIETLVFHPPVQRGANGEITDISAYTELRTQEGRKRTAERIMESLPTLKKFVLVGGLKGKRAYEFYRNETPGEPIIEKERYFNHLSWLAVR
ncbi:hypothetical protein NLJ89_g8679 [Agrocybe chaxingu]|uniref:Uncharacterized protein n=1 Tax=Agrocybe chaxingu TaxID=84603 RepID=A0A9W8K1D8_9AGAR|nr:hypothetical protein NLJ89_g8679 [Agrocybe chaxingu]